MSIYVYFVKKRSNLMLYLNGRTSVESSEKIPVLCFIKISQLSKIKITVFLKVSGYRLQDFKRTIVD